MKTLTLAVSAALGLGLIGFAPVAKADWNPGDPFKMHYPQLPDLSPNGLDVLATYGGFWFDPGQGAYVQLGNKILADDFLCTESGPITDIHIWGSWLYDARVVNPMFHLSIHADIPAGTGGVPFSRPGPVLWSNNITASKERLYAMAPEQFYDPNTSRILGPDTQVWQYNFLIPEALAFQQQAGTIYWLDVQYVTPEPWTTNLFGWKTSMDHWNDYAVFGDNLLPGEEPFFWEPLIGRDLAFVITIPEPSLFALAGLGAAVLVVFRRRK